MPSTGLWGQSCQTGQDPGRLYLLGLVEAELLLRSCWARMGNSLKAT